MFCKNHFFNFPYVNCFVLTAFNITSITVFLTIFINHISYFCRNSKSPPAFRLFPLMSTTLFAIPSSSNVGSLFGILSRNCSKDGNRNLIGQARFINSQLNFPSSSSFAKPPKYLPTCSSVFFSILKCGITTFFLFSRKIRSVQFLFSVNPAS